MRILHRFAWICACFAASAASPAPTHPSTKDSTKGGRREAPPPFCGGGAKRRLLCGWMRGGWGSSRRGKTCANLCKYMQNAHISHKIIQISHTYQHAPGVA